MPLGASRSLPTSRLKNPSHWGQIIKKFTPNHRVPRVFTLMIVSKDSWKSQMLNVGLVYLLSPLPTFFRVETKMTGYSMLIQKNLVIWKKTGYSWCCMFPKILVNITVVLFHALVDHAWLLNVVSLPGNRYDGSIRLSREVSQAFCLSKK